MRRQRRLPPHRRTPITTSTTATSRASAGSSPGRPASTTSARSSRSPYPGRTPHIHFKIRKGEQGTAHHPVLTSRVIRRTRRTASTGESRTPKPRSRSRSTSPRSPARGSVSSRRGSISCLVLHPKPEPGRSLDGFFRPGSMQGPPERIGVTDKGDAWTMRPRSRRDGDRDVLVVQCDLEEAGERSPVGSRSNGAAGVEAELIGEDRGDKRPGRMNVAAAEQVRADRRQGRAPPHWH